MEMDVKSPLALILFLILCGSCSAQTPIRVHCGGSAYTDSKGNQWQADANFVGGGAYSQAAAVTGTPDPALFESIRYAQPGNNFVYTFPVPNGSYTVNLSFAELWIPAPGRKFNVVVNGTAVLSNFDVYAKVGESVADVETIGVTVASGSIVIELDALSGNGFLDAIEILPTGTPVPVVIALPGMTVTFPMAAPPSCLPADLNCTFSGRAILSDGTILNSTDFTLLIVKTTSNNGEQAVVAVKAVKSP